VSKDETHTATGAEPLCELRGITKAFPGVVANDAIHLAVHAGEVHALLGENGAGKSTLINILSGMYRADAGEIRFAGQRAEIDSPRAAIELGIGTVYQHLTLVPTLSVLENLMLGSHGGTAGRLNVGAARERFDELARVLGIEFSPDARAGALALGQQQQVEIMKALWRRGSRVLILDEPTSMLTPQGYEELRAVLQNLKGEGLAVILITHKLHEAIELGDRVTVLRAGRVVGALAPGDVRGRGEAELSARIVEMMFGAEAPELVEAVEVETEPVRRRARQHQLGDVALAVRGIAVSGDAEAVGISEVELEVRAGEIVGVAGVDGNGQRELAEVIAGQRRPSAGEVLMLGEDVTRIGVRGREQRGLRYVTDDRLGEGTVGDLDVGLNTVLKRIGSKPFWRGGTERRDEIDRFAQALVDDYDVRTPSVRTRTAVLSGGNVQKLLLARELSGNPRVAVFNKPTHGLDVRTAEFVREQIREAAAGGLAALVISTEIEELVDLSDRIVVMSRGVVTGEVDNGAENGAGVEERIGALMVARTGGAT
jgi:simple sugar transport system ATP-binding protein